MHRAGYPRQIAIGNVFEREAGQGVRQIANHGKAMRRAGSNLTDFFMSVDVEHRGIGVVGVDGEVTGHDLVEHRDNSRLSFHRSRPSECKVAAVCGLADRYLKDPAHPKVSRAQPP